MTKEEAIELIKRGKFNMPGYTGAEAIEYINETPVGITLIPLFNGDITKENIDNLVREYPIIEITE